VLENTWTAAEQTAILTGAIETGKALCRHGAATTNLEAFREVMQGKDVNNQWRTIKFSRINEPQPVCITNKYSDPMNIQCDVDLLLNEFTVIHELGHVFVGRTIVDGTSSYLTAIEIPGGNSQGQLVDVASTPNFVMGPRGYILKIGPRNDWQRSDVIKDNGWGSAAQ
jgi:hypothetical protein